jgi:hypothetical protein
MVRKLTDSLAFQLPTCPGPTILLIQSIIAEALDGSSKTQYHRQATGINKDEWILPD